jgi:hypothetical protein
MVNFDETYGQNGSGVAAALVVTCPKVNETKGCG